MKIEYVTRRHLINPSKIEYVTHSINHYTGCVHNCQYPCYARTMSRKSEEQWKQVMVAKNALSLVENDLPRLEKYIKDHNGLMPEIMVSSFCDPYPPIEEKTGLTREILKLLFLKGYTVRVLTKSPLIERDLRLFEEYKHNAYVGFTIITLDDQIREKWEPGAPSIKDRIRVLKKAHELELFTWVSVEPIILNESDPLEIITEIGEYCSQMVFGKHNYHFNETYYQPQYANLRSEIIKLCTELRVPFMIKKELKKIQGGYKYPSLA